MEEEKRLNIEDLEPEKVQDVEYWLVTEDDPEEVSLSATTIDEAIEDYKEKVEDDPEDVFGEDGIEFWESAKQLPTARLTVTAYKRFKHQAAPADQILDDVITNIEENGRCFEDNDYRSNKRMLEAAEAFKKVVEEEIDPYYYPAFDVLCFLNKPNTIGKE